MKKELRSLGFFDDAKQNSKEYIHQYIKLRLEALGLVEDDFDEAGPDGFLHLAKSLIINYRERERQFKNYLCPADQRIQNFIRNYFKGVDAPEITIPSFTFTLIFTESQESFRFPKREMSMHLNILLRTASSREYCTIREATGVLLKGVFHIAEGGMPIPDDKKAVPLKTAALLLRKATTIEGDLFNLPFTEDCTKKAQIFVSLLLRPLVSPAVDGVTSKKSMEVRFFAPGSLVSNLDFVESIFGNGGSPYHISNDAGLDYEGWSGHTGCIILAPQLTKLTKKELGLPNVAEATERQKRDGMCWEKPEELYNDGSAFKLTMRTDEGTIVTVIADNYFGYSKKEIKTFISYAANLLGNAEEEHAGGALIFPSYNQGENQITKAENFSKTLEETAKIFPDLIDMQPEGYGKDRNYSDIFYIPELSRFDIKSQKISWTRKMKKR